ILLAVGLALASAGAAAASCGVPAEIGDGWQVATPASASLDDTVLCALPDRFAHANIHSVLVARRGALVFEQYFTGRDTAGVARESRTTFGPQVKHDLRSVTKSVVSLLFGIAAGQQKIANVNEPMLSFFPGYAD